MKIILLNQTHNTTPTSKQFQSWINAVTNMIPIPKKEITINIVDSRTSQTLNKTYRKKDYPTNVLSFHYESIPGISSQSLGDLAICAEIVEKEALEQHTALELHWAHMTIHGTLHLLGYDHEDENDARIMESLEVKILRALRFEDPYS